MSKYPEDPASHAAAVKVAVAAGRAADVDSILEKARSSVPATFESRHRMAVYLWDIVNRDPKKPADMGRRLLTEGIGRRRSAHAQTGFPRRRFLGVDATAARPIVIGRPPGQRARRAFGGSGH